MTAPTQPQKRQYLTTAKIDALLALAGVGQDHYQAEIDDLLNHGELEPADLDPTDLSAYRDRVRTIDLAREARAILASRRKVERTWRR